MILFSLVWLIPASIVKGFVLSKLWEWFVASNFNVATMSIATAIGVSLIVTLLMAAPSTQPEKRDTEWMFKVASITIAWPLLILFVGWVVLNFS